MKKYTLKEISENPKLQEVSGHCDYAGDGKYVIDMSPHSYVNHSCDPNTYSEFENFDEVDLIALRDIKKGEEITYDVVLCAVDQLDSGHPKKGIYYWRIKCFCGGKNCRKIIHGDFFKMPKKYQRENLKYLPTFVKRRFKDKLKRLRCVLKK